MRLAVGFHRQLDLDWACLESVAERCVVVEFLLVQLGLAVRRQVFEVEHCFREAMDGLDGLEDALDGLEDVLDGLEADNPAEAFHHCHGEAVAAAVDLLDRSAVAEDKADHMCLDSCSSHRAFDLPRCLSRLRRQRRLLDEAAGCIAAGSRRTVRKGFHIRQRWNPRWHARGLFARRNLQRSAHAESRRFANPLRLRLAIH